jgi:flagellar hook-associated protein 1 FlgK
VVNTVVWQRSGTPLETTGGKLGALLEMRDTTVPGYQTQLDTFARGLVEGLNGLHASGGDLEGRAGRAFFDPVGTSADTIALALEPGRDESRVVAGADGGIGDGALALAIAALGDQAQDGLGGRSLNQVYRGLAVAIGQHAGNATRDLEVQTSFITSLEEQRQALTGVNLDEEMTTMLVQQQAYQAAGRLIATIDEMMQSLLALV